MAGDWIPWQKGLAKKPEILAIARASGRSRLEIAAIMMEFWEWVDGESVDGCLGASLGDLPGLIAGTDSVVWDAVVSVGWLRVTPCGISIPNFERWLGRSAKRRLKDAERKTTFRKSSACEPEKNVGSVLSSSLNHSPENQDGGLSRGSAETVVESFPETPEGLAQAWCFITTRLWNGVARDSATDLEIDFAEIIRLGASPKQLMASIMDVRRDRGEQFFEFRDRALGKKGKGSPPKPLPTNAERAAQTIAQRAADREQRAKRVTMAEVKAKLAKES